MKTSYILFFRSKGLRLGILAALGLLACTSINAQISGSYTIDRNGTASATVYKSFKAVIDDLKGVTRSDGGTANNTGSGVTGNATFTVKVGSGPYTWTSADQLVIPSIGTMSSTKTVTFKGNNETINYTGSSSNRPAIRLDDADWFRFDSLKIYSLATSSAWGIHFKNSADNNIIQNCVVRCPNVASEAAGNYSSNSGCIVFSTENASLNGFDSYGWGGAAAFGNNGNNNIIRNNSIGGKDDGTSSGTGPAFGVFLLGTTSGTGSASNLVEKNNITNCFYYSVYCGFADGAEIKKNNITNPEAAPYNWGAAAIYSNYLDNSTGQTVNTTKQTKISQNRIYKNHINQNTAYYYYGIYAYDAGNAGTVIDNNAMYDIQTSSVIYGIYAYGYPGRNLKFEHNTFSYDHPTQTNSPTVYGIFNLTQSNFTADYQNNIISMTQPGGTGTRYGIYDYNWGGSTYNYNNVYVNRNNGGTPATNDYYGYKGSTKKALSDWQAAGSGAQSTEFASTFVDWATGDLRPLSFELNNTGRNLGYTKDINDSNRTVATPDKGAFEVKIDASCTAFPWTGLNECGNYTEVVKVTIKNNNTFAIKNVPVSWQINNNTPVTEIITSSIAAGASLTYTFNAVPRFNKPGANTIKAGVGVADDDASNNTITVNLNITKTPEGSILSQKAGAKGIYNPGSAFDITVPNDSLIYQFTPPAGLTNAQYGAAAPFKWNGKAEVRSFTSGLLVTGATPIVKVPSGPNNMEVAFDPPFAMTDSMLVLNIIFTDPSTNCDTTISKKIFVAPRCNPAFEFPTTVCEGENVLFDNFSTVSSKFLTYKWEFGTTKVEDTANSTNPVFTFPGSGAYKVTLRCKTDPYGYVDTLVKTVTVTPIPTVAFTRTNACEGDAVKLINNTTPTGASFEWTLGDGSPTVLTTDVNKVYATPGGYAVTLRAEKNGCAAKITKNVYQFARPIANASLISGSCDNEKFKFGNTTTISIGASGYLWNFDEPNAISTDKSPEYKFTSPGVKKVRLTAVSEFGCTDTLNTPLLVTVKAAPKASFTNTDPCSQTPTVFTNTSNTPSGSPTNTWTIEGVTDINNAATRSHTWANLGKQTVVLQVASDNGCTDVFTKELNVLIQPVADFSVANICQGEPAVFTNLTTWPEGQITYTWDFGDGGVSTDGAPIHAYNNNVTGQRNVVLTAQIIGGCTSSKSIAVEVKEKPSTCDFEFKNNYNAGLYAFDLNPTGPSGSSTANTNYKWVYSFGGTDQTVAAGKIGKVMSGALNTVQVTMIATKNGCECSVTKGLSQQEINKTVGTNQLPNGGEFKIYPNPSNGNVNIEVANNNENLVVEIFNAVGAKVATVNTNNANNGIFNINLAEQAAGLYIVKVTAANQTVAQRITITK